MVAATIVIAGVIMAMLGGFAPVEPPRTVSVAVTQSAANNISIVFHGGPDGGMVNTLNLSVNGEHKSEGKPMKLTAGALPNVLPVGNTSTFYVQGLNAGPGNDHVIVTATFTDGVEQVVLDVLV
jgi:FlaG/FlaF family flagellin (archaellin)